MAESKRENSNEIHSYLKKSLDALKGHDDTDTRRKVYYDIAKFADEEYKQVLTFFLFILLCHLTCISIRLLLHK